MRDSMTQLVELKPTEYEPKRKRRRVWKYEFYKRLTIDKLRQICAEKSMLEDPEIYESNEGIVYHYPNKPTLIIHEGRIHTTEDRSIDLGQPLTDVKPGRRFLCYSLFYHIGK